MLPSNFQVKSNVLFPININISKAYEEWKQSNSYLWTNLL